MCECTNFANTPKPVELSNLNKELNEFKMEDEENFERRRLEEVKYQQTKDLEEIDGLIEGYEENPEKLERIRKFKFYFKYSCIIFASVTILLVSAIFIITNITLTSVITSLTIFTSSVTAQIATTFGIRVYGEVDAISPSPSLIVFLVVDQLRSDEVQKYRKKYSPFGFNELFSNGIFFRNAHYNHANTFTAVGHSSLISGGNSASHGIVANEWFTNDGKLVYAAEDIRYHEVDGKENITGTAPTFMESTTIGDELRMFTNSSKVFSISGKDRGAIFVGGHLGKSFWYSTRTGNFISSTYYFKKYPQYVKDWNDQNNSIKKYLDTYWNLKYTQDEYLYQDRSYTPSAPFGKDFPRHLYDVDHQYFTKEIMRTPFVDEMTVDFAIKVMEKEGLGKTKGVTDFIGISLSNLDYVQHHYGANSLEAEDVIYRVDDRLEKLFSFLKGHLGSLDNVLISLAADHGVDIAWRKAKDMGFDAGILGDEMMQKLNDHLNETYEGKLSGKFVEKFFSPNVYFNKKNILNDGKIIEEIEKLCVEFLIKQKEVYYAFSRSDMMKGNIPNLPTTQRMQRSFHPKRGGNVLIIPSQHYITTSHKTTDTFASHGSPYAYDTYVPVFFRGKDIARGVVNDRKISPTDIAPTICAYFSLKPPSGCLSEVIPEVLTRRDINKVNY